MIVTVTPNPSVDRTIGLESLTRGAVHRAVSARVDPGGKGVNVSRALRAHGATTTAVLPLGGSEGTLLADLLQGTGVDVMAVPISGSTRANISIVEPDGTTTKLNEPGPQLGPADERRLLGALSDLLSLRPAWVVASGSLPPGLDAGFYARVVETVHAQGVPVAVDTTGAALLAAVQAGADLVKPNDDELAEATGTALRTMGDVVAAAQALRVSGQVVVSLGARGALLVDESGAVLATTPPRVPLSTVGAGDSLLAGYLFAGTADARALATAVTWGTAAVGLPGSQMPTPADVIGIDVTLSEPVPSLLLEGSTSE